MFQSGKYLLGGRSELVLLFVIGKSKTGLPDDWGKRCRHGPKNKCLEKSQEK